LTLFQVLLHSQQQFSRAIPAELESQHVHIFTLLLLDFPGFTLHACRTWQAAT
jgi:hypothetical protein